MKLKRFICLLLTLLMLISAANISVAAEFISSGTTGFVNIQNYCVEGASSYSAGSAGSYVYERLSGDRTYLRMMYLSGSQKGSPRFDNKGNILWVYCIEFGTDISSGNTRTAQSILNSSVWTSLSQGQRDGIELASLYGFPADNLGVSAADAYAATQAVMWEFQTGIRKSVTSNTRAATSYKGKTLGADYMLSMLKTYPAGANKRAVTAYNNLISKIYAHPYMPSFSGQNVSMKYDVSKGAYVASLYDSRGIIGKCKIDKNNSNLSVSVSGSTVTLSSKSPISNAEIKLTKTEHVELPQNLMFLSADSGQASVLGQTLSRSTARLNVSTDITSIVGYVQISKTATDTKKPLKGAKFNIYLKSDTQGENSLATLVTNDEGIAKSGPIKYGSYYMKEVEAPAGYELSNERKDFQITEPVKVLYFTADNKNKLHKISVYKQGEIFKGFEEGSMVPLYEVGFLSGCVVDIFAAQDIVTSDGTLRYKKDELVDTVTTDSTGPVQSGNLFEGEYYIREKDAPVGYEKLAEDFPVSLFDDQDVILEDKRIRIELNFQKRLTGSESFDEERRASLLSQVSFGIYTGEDIIDVPVDTLIETIEVDSDGELRLKSDLPFGYKFYVKEITTAEGYKLDDKRYEITYELEGEKHVWSINDGKDIENEMIPVAVTNPPIEVDGGTPLNLSRGNPNTGDVNCGSYNRSIIIYSFVAIVSAFALAIIRKKL